MNNRRAEHDDEQKEYHRRLTPLKTPTYLPLRVFYICLRNYQS
ncbi:hypothetical protein [uncultured Shewanella sp.]|nr:hypothetical protein [uncultured Shewanella sp.]